MAGNTYLHYFNNVNIFLLLNVGAWKFHTQKELLIKILTCETDFTGYTKKNEVLLEWSSKFIP